MAAATYPTCNPAAAGAFAEPDFPSTLGRRDFLKLFRQHARRRTAAEDLLMGTTKKI